MVSWAIVIVVSVVGAIGSAVDEAQERREDAARDAEWERQGQEEAVRQTDIATGEAALAAQIAAVAGDWLSTTPIEYLDHSVSVNGQHPLGLTPPGGRITTAQCDTPPPQFDAELPWNNSELPDGGYPPDMSINCSVEQAGFQANVTLQTSRAFPLNAVTHLYDGPSVTSADFWVFGIDQTGTTAPDSDRHRVGDGLDAYTRRGPDHQPGLRNRRSRRRLHRRSRRSRRGRRLRRPPRH